MKNADIFKELNEKAKLLYLPHISLDFVIFGFYQGTLSVLLLKSKRNQKWMLPGGFVNKEEDLNEAVLRGLKERTSVEKVYPQLFNVFGTANRTEGSYNDYKSDFWIRQRFITLGYYALVDASSIYPVPDELSEQCIWHAVTEIPELALDHQSIFNEAYSTLKQHINYKPIGSSLMPKQFTIPDLQKLYESIVGHKMHRSNFSRKILSFKILKKLDEPKKGVAHKAPYLYEFDMEQYELALVEGLEKLW